MKNLLLITVICLYLPLFAQEQVIQPDPNTGRPLLIQSMDGLRWELPILVYTESDFEIFVGQDSLIASVPLFAREGKFYVHMYTYYKNDYACKKMFTPAQKANIPNFSEVCKFIGYRLRWLTVDTHGHLYKMPMQFLIDTDGDTSSPIKGSEKWFPVDTSPDFLWLRTSIKNISERIQREMQKEKLKGQF